MNQPVFFNKKLVGEIINDVFVSHRDYKKHFFKIFSGFGISYDICDILESKGVEDIIIICDEKIYKARLDTFKLYGKEFDNPLIKDDKQLVLDIHYFKELKPFETIKIS